MDFASLSAENDGFRYVLRVIDSFSRFVWVQPLRSKSAQEVLAAFKNIVSAAPEQPYQLLTDRGKEFFNKQLSAYLETLNTIHFAPSDDTFKAALAERAIRSFKSILYKILTSTLSYRYIDVLQKIADSMNNRVHSSINMAPKNVNDGNILKVWKYVQQKRLKKPIINKKPTPV